jgi:hypothetical protein
VFIGGALALAGACVPAEPEASAATPQAAAASGMPAAAGTHSSVALPRSTAAATTSTAPATVNTVNAAQSPQPDAQATPADSPDIMPCEVSRILATNCQTCHGAMPIGGAPMSLVTYADLHAPAKTQPSMKVYELSKLRMHDELRRMPPIGTLPANEVSALDAWFDGGALAGTAQDATCDTTPAETTARGPGSKDGTHGRIEPGPGETCYEFKVHQSTTSVDDVPFAIADGEQYEQFYYNVPWPAESVAVSYATITDNAAVLHHWLLFATNELQQEGAHITAPVPTLIGTDPQLLTGWAVGGPNLEMPEDVGMELPNPGRTINVQWHFYNSTGMPQADASSVQVCTVPKSTRPNVGSVTWAGTEDLNGNVWTGGAGMPPNQESTFSTTCRPGGGDKPIHIVGFEPHMHRIGKRMSTSVNRTDGTSQVIFDEPFVFGSETHYFNAYDLMPGETLTTSCTFFNDNSFGVPFGESTDSEMCYQFVFHYPAHALSNGAFSLLGVTDTCW